MNTDACNVEDMNVDQIGECSSLSCVAYYDNWSNIFCTRSFPLCKNDREFNETSDSLCHGSRTNCGTEMANAKQIQQMIPLITCEIPFGKMSASWFSVSMYLTWILESKLIRSNNQSRATLWVLETCLIVGLLPLIIILITASLSSNTYNKASRLADWTFEGTASMSLVTSILL